MNIDDLVIENELLRMQKRQEKIDEIQKSIQDVTNSEIEVFNILAHKLNPLIYHLRDNGFYFGNPKFDYKSSIGPVLAHDKQEGVIYCYQADNDQIVKQTIHIESKPTYYNKREFFENYKFEDAIAGLEFIFSIYDLAEDSLKNELEKKTTIVERYKNQLT